MVIRRGAIIEFMLSKEIRPSLRQRGHAALVGFVVIILVAVAATGAIAWRHRNTSHKAAATTSSTTSAANPMTAALPSGADNASLQADLANLNSANAQDSQNISSANTAVNDQQNEITVPTN